MATLGFIGCGNMGGALARAACKSVPSDQVFLANRTPEKAKALAEELGCRVADNAAIAESADFIFLGVKPQMMADMLADISRPRKPGDPVHPGVYGGGPDDPPYP